MTSPWRDVIDTIATISLAGTKKNVGSWRNLTILVRTPLGWICHIQWLNMEVFNHGCIQRWIYPTMDISNDGDTNKVGIRWWRYPMIEVSNNGGIRRWWYPMMVVFDQRLKKRKIQKLRSQNAKWQRALFNCVIIACYRSVIPLSSKFCNPSPITRKCRHFSKYILVATLLQDLPYYPLIKKIFFISKIWTQICE